jgi:hypothetical protein
MEISEYLLEGVRVSVRGRCMGGAKNAQRRENIKARGDGCVHETAQEARVDVHCHPGKGGGMCARPARKPGSIGRDDGLESVMPYLARMPRMYLD